MQGSKSPYDIETNLTLSSHPPQNSTHQNIFESEHILNQSNSSSTTQASVSGEPVSEVLAKSSPEHNLTDKSAPTGVLKASTVSNGPEHGIRQSAFWGRTPGKKNLSMESIDIGNVDEFEIDKLEVTKTDLQCRIAEQAKGNAILQENLEKHKNALIERRLALEQDVARLQEQLQQERELRLAVEAGLKMCQDTTPVSFSIDGKIKTDLEDIALVEADVIDLKQTADDLTLQLNQLREQNSDLMRDPVNLPEQSSNHQEKLKGKQKDLEATSTKRTFDKSTRNKGQSNKADAEKDMKQESASLTKKHVPQNQQSDPVQNSKYAATPPTSSSVESVTSKRCTVPSKRQGTTRSEQETQVEVLAEMGLHAHIY